MVDTWRLSNIPHQFLSLTAETVCDWLRRLKDSATTSLLEQVLSILWALWTCRNEWIFKLSSSTPQSILLRGARLLEDYREVNGRIVEDAVYPMAQSLSVWIPPNPGIICFNSDAAMGTTSTGLGIIARNSDGHCIFSAHECLHVRMEVAVSEALAVRKGLWLARQFGIERLQFQSDCLELVQAISSRSHTHSTLAVIVDDILHLAQSFVLCDFVHIRRTANVVAHGLAKRATVVGLSEFFQGFCPFELDCNMS